MVTKIAHGQKGNTAGVRDELWYDKPAEQWLEALPLGNGRLGAMAFGGVKHERIALSESTAWSGAPTKDGVNPEARTHLDEIRRLLFEGRYDEAQTLAGRSLPGRMKNFGTNLPLPELLIDCDMPSEVGRYRRSLNLDEAIANVDWIADGVRYRREVFSSHADRVLVVRLHSDGENKISFRLRFSAAVFPGSVQVQSDALCFDGHAWEKMHSDGRAGVALRIEARIQADGGTVRALQDSIEVSNANDVRILLAVGTSFGDADPKVACEDTLHAASGKSYSQLRRAHLDDFQPLYRRMVLDIGVSSKLARNLPTDKRRKVLEDGADDPELLALFFQYGRYLTIAGSREDSPLPLALQGIWNDGLASSMGWTDDFHLDINTEQNYWPAEVCNLSECQTPLFRLLEGLSRHGQTTAAEMYGAPGWVAHTVTNPWGYSAPGGLGWGIFVTAGVWISLQLWEHWRFGQDVKFLRERAYPILRSSAEFFLQYMTTEPKHGWLVTGPSESPENAYLTPTGGRASVSMGATCDRVLVEALFSMCIEASTMLDVDSEFRGKLESARQKLPPFQVGKHGQLQEWLEDFDEAYPNHRHTSHLISLYPECQISPRKTPQLARAAEVTIERRLHAPNWEQSEWGRANLVVYYARLLKGDEAQRYFVGLLAKSTGANLLTFSSGGVAGAEQNIFAIDGNTAGTAGLAEMLVQSQGGEIELLPALPAAWRTGSVKGLCARGGFVIDLSWGGGRLRSAFIRSCGDAKATVRYGEKTMRLTFQKNQPLRIGPGMFVETPNHNRGI
ncbi:glycoside hydrolase family 95 protein [Silvibacterium acidisoli]|uniref:glycoside hydrolase family 95 protein n=1 Tax=Acidobacteriaceae bacterium ZG23-2 TaxID=2883246 RepID=UPI00406C0AF3